MARQPKDLKPLFRKYPEHKVLGGKKYFLGGWGLTKGQALSAAKQRRFEGWLSKAVQMRDGTWAYYLRNK